MLIPSDEAALEPEAEGPFERDLFPEAFRHAPLPMALVDADDRIVAANPAFSTLSGHDAGDLAGVSLSALTHPEDREMAACARRTVRAGHSPCSSTDVRLLGRDGRTVWVSLHCAPLAGKGAEPGPLVVQLVDLTERRRTERELARSNAELSSFAYLAAHELKSPLQALTGFTALLERIHGPQLVPQARELVRWILDGATRMDTLIDALLAYCVVDRTDTVLAPVSLQAAVDDAVGQLEREVSGRRAVVRTGALPVVTGDPVQLGQLLQNLVANALKFVPEGRAPQVDVSAERTPDGWTVTVADNGIGVEDGARERIFTMFERLHPRERFEGTGIGLSICKRIVERRGGRIWVEANLAGGSRFRFTVPDVPGASTRPAA